MKDLFKKLEVLEDVSLIELEFGRFLYSLDKAISKNIILAGMYCVQSQINGHICCSITDILSNPLYKSFLRLGITEGELLQDLGNAKVVGQPGEIKPLIIDGENVYLQKLWKYEQELADFLNEKSSINHGLVDGVKEHSDKVLIKDFKNVNLQKSAVLLSFLKDLIIISGGPGTGKTYTINKIIEAQYSKDKKPSIALATPTGKAAQRLNESLEIKALEYPITPAVTIHKLLQSKGSSGNFKYNEKNKLPFDILIIDEASMLDIYLWIRIIRALPKTSKLILLGDKNQLSSVEAGSILGDICSGADNTFSNTSYQSFENDISSKYEIKSVNDCIIELTKSYRFNKKSGIGLLSELINAGKTDEAISLLKNESYPDVSISNPTNEVFETMIRNLVIKPFLECTKNGFSFELLKRNQILCALRKGPFGVDQVNKFAEKSVKKKLGISLSEEWYEGRPILITRNNSLLKVRNGEVGICKRNEQSGLFEIEFEDKEKSRISVSRIQDYESAFAITIHKSQGSEYDHVSIMLSNQPNPLLSKQLLYTAVTRARKSVLVLAGEAIISSTIQQNRFRRSGLIDKIWKV